MHVRDESVVSTRKPVHHSSLESWQRLEALAQSSWRETDIPPSLIFVSGKQGVSYMIGELESMCHSAPQVWGAGLPKEAGVLLFQKL